MWLSGKRVQPAFTYTLATRAGRALLDDDVSFIDAASGREKHIRGVDTPAPAGGPAAFVWRGRGALAFVTSRWRVAHLDDAADRNGDGNGDGDGDGNGDGDGPQWAVIAFSRTLFTPAGLDVIARAPALRADVRDHVRGLIAASDLAPLGRALVQLPLPARAS